MGGSSSQQKTESSVTQPWAPAQPFLGSVLGQLQGQLNKTGITGTENSALNNTEANANNFASIYSPVLAGNANELLGGGGALNQAGAVNQNYQNYYNQTNPLASNTNYNPYDTPGLRDALSTLSGDITQGVNGQFAAAGRDFSGANSQALGRGLTQGLAPALLGQYNQNIQNQQGAAGNLYSAGNTNAGILAGLQQQSLANKQAGAGAANQAWQAQNAGNNTALEAEAARRGITPQALGMLAQIGIPIAGLGNQSTGTSNTTTQMPWYAPISAISGALGNFGTGKAFPSIIG